MDTDRFIIYIKIEDVYEEIVNDIDEKIDTSNYECDRPLPTGKNKNITDIMKDELGEKTMTEFVALRVKTYSFLMDDNIDVKKGK